ncbi:MAG TPA: efflux RND transporter periplasmic adaptor subunit [Candidatus Krumholzibacteria bacterium]|nr:efflux RND transporter periplasmic adaptor subunit [Candidatus Krumholzibacteria bacterium]
MAKRMILMLATIAVFLGVIGLVKFRQIQTAIAQASAFQPPPEAVTTIVAEQEQWPSTLHAIGTMVAVHGVTVSADLPGIVEKISFDSGRTVGAGDVLVQLDTSQERAQLAAAEAQRDLANINLERFRGLREKGVTSQAEYDRASAEAKEAEARVGEIGATIERKTIRAPFAGILGIRQVNLGQYLSGGDPVVPLQTLHPIYVNFAVPQQEVAALVVGAEVRLTLEGKLGVEFPGKITAINSIVDEATRNVEVQATFANADGTLRPGMFVETQVVVGAGTPMIALPASSVQYAPYGNTVFLVEEIKGKDGKSYLGVRQQFVKLGSARGDQVAVLSGVEPGAQVVTSGVFKLRNGAAVQVNNEVQPGNNPSPQPEDS